MSSKFFQQNQISSFDDLKSLHEIPAGTEFIEQRGSIAVKWSNDIDPLLTNGVDYSSWYMISNMGESYSIATHKLMCNSKNRQNGYFYVNFYRKELNDGRITRVAISRLVARIFTPVEELPQNWQELDAAHKDSDTNNNRVENLCFQSHKENCNELHHKIALSAANQGKRRTIAQRKHQSEARKGIGTKPIIQLDTAGNVVDSYPSITDAAQKTGADSGNISAVCNGRRHTAGGYHWQFI